MDELKRRLVPTAQRAYRQTRFYREYFEREPDNLVEIPAISVADYQRAAGLLDCIVSREAMIGILPPYFKEASRFPFTIPEDEAELILRQRRIIRALNDLGIDLKASPRFLIVADERRGPFACELAKGIYWEGLQASITYLSGPSNDLKGEIERFEPDYLFLASGREFRGALGRQSSSTILVEHCSDRLIDDRVYPAMIYADEVDLIGSRPIGRPWYDYDADQLLLELDARSSLTLITKLRFTCFPLVRYGLGQFVPTVDDLNRRVTE